MTDKPEILPSNYPVPRGTKKAKSKRQEFEEELAETVAAVPSEKRKYLMQTKELREKQCQEAFNLWMAGVPIDNIANLQGLSRNTIKSRLKAVKKHLKFVNEVRGLEIHKTEMLKATEVNLLRSINDPEKLKEASLSQVAGAFERVHKVRRLETGQSTDNTSIKIEGSLNLNDFK